jgi:hypothetical protein
LDAIYLRAFQSTAELLNLPIQRFPLLWCQVIVGLGIIRPYDL